MVLDLGAVLGRHLHAIASAIEPSPDALSRIRARTGGGS
jgi:hypothetical protein